MFYHKVNHWAELWPEFCFAKFLFYVLELSCVSLEGEEVLLAFEVPVSFCSTKKGVLILRKRPLPILSLASFTTHYTFPLINKIVILIVKS